jgi:hypothetical protein
MARGGLQKAIIVKEDLPPLSIFNDGTIGHYVQYRIVSEDKNRYSHWSPIYKVLVSSFSLQGSVDVTVSDNSIACVWGDELSRPRYDVFVKWGNTIEKILITADGDSLFSTVRLEVSSNTHYQTGETIVVVSGQQSSLVSGTFLVSDTQTINLKKYVYYKISGTYNTAGEVTDGSGEVSGGYVYHGTPSVHMYSFIRIFNYDFIYVSVQAESIEKQYSSDLLMYDSIAIPLP